MRRPSLSAVEIGFRESPASDVRHTDSTQAERFAREYGRRYRYDHRRGLWLHWGDDHAWHEDGTGGRYADAIALARKVYREATRLEPEDRRRVAAFATSAESRNRLDAVLHLARHLPPIADTGDAWDTDPWLLNTPGGVVDLRTGAIRPATPEDRLLLRTSVAPATEPGRCPRWVRFVAEIFADDTEIVAWFQRLCGYLLTGITSEQFFVLGWGAGANGKGTCFNTLARVMGSYAHNLPFSALEMQARNAVPTDLASMVGRRFVTASESSESARLNEARIKALTGCDPISARFLFQDYFTFTPVAKFVLFTNAKPVVRDESHGMWRRIRLLPFTRTFTVDPTLGPTLDAEGPGILRWMVDGCLLWQSEGGFTTPSAISAATSEYQAEQDALQPFLDARCEVSPSASCRAGELYAAFKSWADSEGLSPRERLSQRAFGMKVKARFDSVEERSGWRYLGVGLV